MILIKTQVLLVVLSAAVAAGPVSRETVGQNDAGAIGRQQQQTMEYHRQRRELEQIRQSPKDEKPPVEIQQEGGEKNPAEKKPSKSIQEKENQKE